jgi:N-acetylglucosamine kinase-like BadF-type ATPase
MARPIWKLGVDVGGTFTDAVLYNDTTGEIYRAKVRALSVSCDLCLAHVCLGSIDA